MAPFWRQPGHVGNIRVDRFVRWLAQDGFEVVIVRAGSAEVCNRESWGTEITVKDPLGLYRDCASTNLTPRKPNKLRRTLSYWVFNPDPGIVWAKAAAFHPVVLYHAKGAAFILSSSPPESAHISAELLSARCGAPHIVDMRDGWLDEPLKPILRDFPIRRWQEGRLEARILRRAHLIQVTSTQWRELLCSRYPLLAEKTVVLTNGYPSSTGVPDSVNADEEDREVTLLHAGQFLGSRSSQSPSLLFDPLLEGVKQFARGGAVLLYGHLSQEDKAAISKYAPSFGAEGWRIVYAGTVSRPQILQHLRSADGLLLLSASYAAIPSKLFEYIPAIKPILVVTERGGATWRLCESLPQATLISSEDSGHSAGGRVAEFLRRITERDLSYAVPSAYSETALRSVFLSSLKRTTAVS